MFQLTNSITEDKITRLGHKRRPQDPNQRPRPIKLTLPDTDLRASILKKSRKLKASKFERVGFSDDLTKRQQKVEFDLRQ